MQTLDRAQQVPDFDQLPEREREGRLCTSLPALQFYARTGHSFVADNGHQISGFALAQSVWQGDRPIVLIRVILADDQQAREGLLRAVVKSAYDTAVYEVHAPISEELKSAAGEAYALGTYGVIHLGTRSETAPGQQIRENKPC